MREPGAGTGSRTEAEPGARRPVGPTRGCSRSQGGGPGGILGGGGGGGPQVLRLTEEEMAAVNRLADMGFDRTEAAQAYLACDKNEALAANLLMDSMGDGGGFGFGGGGGGAGGGSNQDGNNDAGSGNGGDDMYD